MTKAELRNKVISIVTSSYYLGCAHVMEDREEIPQPLLAEDTDAIMDLIRSQREEARAEGIELMAKKIEYATNPAAPETEYEQELWEQDYEGMDWWDLLEKVKSESLSEGREREGGKQ